MDHPLPGCALKLDRAKTHFRALHEEMGKFLRDQKPHFFRGEVDMEKSRYILRVHVNKDPPPEWSLLVGDFVQNLRAALDYLVWQLVRANGQEPGRSNAFPIMADIPTLRNGNLPRWNSFLRGVHPGAIESIRKFQPYLARDGHHSHPLRRLQLLSNEDKHRTILRSYATLPDPEIADPRAKLTPVRDIGAIQEQRLITERPLKDGDEILSSDLRIIGPNPQIQFKGEIPFDVAFGERPVALQGLHDIFDAVDAVIAHFAKAFFGGSADPEPLDKRLGHA